VIGAMLLRPSTICAFADLSSAMHKSFAPLKLHVYGKNPASGRFRPGVLA
jgi:hypothetical protein